MNSNEDKIILWGRLNSINVQTVLWTARELGLSIDQRDLGGAFGGLDGDAYGAINPNRRIPTLQDGATVIWESNAIIRYLAASYGAKAGSVSLWPEEPAERAVADMWMDWKKTSLMDPMRIVFWGLVRTAPEKRDEDSIKGGTAEAIRLYTILNSWLTGRDYILGSHFSMGDIPIGALTYRFINLVQDRPALPALEAWYERLCERPCYNSTVMITIT